MAAVSPWRRYHLFLCKQRILHNVVDHLSYPQMSDTISWCWWEVEPFRQIRFLAGEMRRLLEPFPPSPLEAGTDLTCVSKLLLVSTPHRTMVSKAMCMLRNVNVSKNNSSLASLNEGRWVALVCCFDGNTLLSGISRCRRFKPAPVVALCSRGEVQASIW